MLWWQPLADTPMKGLHMKQAMMPNSRATCAQIWRQVVEHPVQLKLTGRVLVVALDHVEAHLAGILHDLHVDRAQALELVDVVAIRIGVAAIRLAVLILLQPHHLGLGAHAQLQTVVLCLEILVEAAKIAAAIRGEEPTRILLFLAVAEQRAVHARDPLVPGQLHEGLWIGNADKLGRLGTVAEIFAMAVEEQIDRGAIDELKALLGDALPMIGWNALAHDAARDRHELQIEILDPELVDLAANFLDALLTFRIVYIAFDIHRHLPCPQLHGNGLWEVGCSSPLAKRPKRNGSRSVLFSPSSSCATSLPTPIIL